MGASGWRSDWDLIDSIDDNNKAKRGEEWLVRDGLVQISIDLSINHGLARSLARLDL